MATTQQDLVEEILSGMYGFTQQQPAATTLTGALGTTDVNIPYDSTVNVAKGVVEIGDELIYIMQAVTASNTLTTASWGRGYQGTTAATHASGSRILIKPLFPRKNVGDAINEVINKLSSSLYGVTSYEFTPTAAVNTYALPSGARDVLDAKQQTYGPSLQWMQLSHYDVDSFADVSLGQRSITFGQSLVIGRSVKLTVTNDLLPISPGGLLTDSLLPESCRDIVVMGVQIKLLYSLDAGRLQTISVEGSMQNAQVPITSASAIAGRLNNLYQARIQEETRALMQRYPARLSRAY